MFQNGERLFYSTFLYLQTIASNSDKRRKLIICRKIEMASHVVWIQIPLMFYILLKGTADESEVRCYRPELDQDVEELM